MNNLKETLNLEQWKNFIKVMKENKAKFIQMFFVVIIAALSITMVPIYLKYFIDNFIAEKSLDGIKYAAFFFFLVIIIAVLSIYLFLVIGGKIEYKIAYQLREEAFLKSQKLSLNYYDNHSTGETLSVLTSDITKLSEIISWGIIDLTYNLMVFIISIIALLVLSPKLTLMSLLIGVPIALISKFFQERILKYQRKVRYFNSVIFNDFNENIQGTLTTKTLNTEDISFTHFKENSNSMKYYSIKSFKISGIYVPLVMFLGSVGAAVALNFSSKMVMSGEMTFGTFAAFLTYAAQIFAPIRVIAKIASDFKTATASVERVNNLFSEEESIKDSDNLVDKYGNIFEPKLDKYPKMHGDIEFKNVNFGYDENNLILKDFNLKVKAGESIALVGSTGSGKSTIINLLCRFYEPTNGQILIDNKDYREYTRGYIYNNLGYVLQSPFLFSGTILSNRKSGKLDASYEEVVEASKIVGAYEFIMKLPNKFDTIIDEGGSSLSTGQKQLISFARAIIRDPKLIVLDEATSSIDSKTEKTIQKAIDKIVENKTSFIVAHRLSTIKNSDRILVIDDGKIVESGTHDELILKKEKYYNLYTNQFVLNSTNI